MYLFCHRIYDIINKNCYYRGGALKKHICILFVFAILLASVIPRITVFASERMCISDIKIESGVDAGERLEADGYTVLFQNLNPSSENRMYLGYKLGEKAITNLIVSSELKSNISVGSISYHSVSSLNLNQGTDGKPVYLYSTTDAGAGNGIIALSFIKDNKDKRAKLLESINDGSVPVRTVDGNPADFDEGIGERDLFLLTVREKACLPYVSDIKIVNVNSSENAFRKIVSSGCNYFCNEPLTQTDSSSTYLCCNRTADVSEALRSVVISDSSEIDGITYQSAGSCNINGERLNLYYTKDKTEGNPVVEVVKGSLFYGNFTLGEWAKSYFSGVPSSARSSIYSENTYNTLIESDEEYTQLQIKNRSNNNTAKIDLYMIVSANGLNIENSDERSVVLPDEQKNENGELQHDIEVNGIEKEEETRESTDKSLNAYGSAISGGSLIAIAVMAITAVIAVSIMVIVKDRKNSKSI